MLIPRSLKDWLFVMPLTTSLTMWMNTCHMSNHGRTRLLDRSSLTIIAVGKNRFYNDSTSLLRRKESQSTMWSCFKKHTFELGRSCRRPQRMHIIKCWNSNPNLPQRVVSHSLGMRYAISVSFTSGMNAKVDRRLDSGTARTTPMIPSFVDPRGRMARRA
ncbi:NBS-LRR type resistance protein [Cucumis melo var. makuwa]|uniref:NBS-LRR type resistance protein n=1 Tax=Cucumis melo var. makuwa TaxID=1194695 RepID=A0A5A7V928_CUCMM|nr:NBS-LRR type resistance protein [Cucumis melo var. makuwa]